MALPVLYSFRRCPYAMRARLALHASGVDVEHREILLKDKPQAMLTASPKGTVPVLVLPDGRVLDESLDVAFWALGRNDPENWLAPFKSDLDASRSLIERNDGPFKHHLDRYKYASRYEEIDAREHRAAGLDILEDLNCRLAPSGFLDGQAFSFLDAAIAPFVRQFRIPEPSWFDALDLPALHQWLNAFLDSERFQAIMFKYNVWKNDPVEKKGP